MINKEKITRLDIYGENGERLLSTKAFNFPRDFFKIKGYELVSVRGNDLPVLKKAEQISIIFEYLNGTRIKCKSKVDISTPQQMNFHVDDGVVLEERRRSFKVNTSEPAYILRIEREDDIIDLEEQQEVKILNINLTGILMKSDMDIKISDVLSLKMLDGAMELRAEILRRQMNTEGELVGYGCRFLDVTQSQEERLARYLFECQLAARDQRKKNESR